MSEYSSEHVRDNLRKARERDDEIKKATRLGPKRAAGLFKISAGQLIEGTAERCFDGLMAMIEELDDNLTKKQVYDIMILLKDDFVREILGSFKE